MIKNTRDKNSHLWTKIWKFMGHSGTKIICVSFDWVIIILLMGERFSCKRLLKPSYLKMSTDVFISKGLLNYSKSIQVQKTKSNCIIF